MAALFYICFKLEKYWFVWNPSYNIQTNLIDYIKKHVDILDEEANTNFIKPILTLTLSL